MVVIEPKEAGPNPVEEPSLGGKSRRAPGPNLGVQQRQEEGPDGAGGSSEKMVGQLPTAAAAAVAGDDRPLDDAGISGAARAAISAGGGIERRDELGGCRPARPRVVVGFDPGLQIPSGLGDGRGVVGAGLPGMDRRHQRRLQEQVGGVVGGHPMYLFTFAIVSLFPFCRSAYLRFV